MVKRTMCLYMDSEVYKAYRKAIAPKSVSCELEAYMRKCLSELGDNILSQTQEPVDYDALSRDHDKLVREVDRLEKWLKKRDVYDDLLKLAASLGVTNKDLSRLDEAAPKLLKDWSGFQEDAFQFISLIKNVRAKRELERKMAEAIKTA